MEKSLLDLELLTHKLIEKEKSLKAIKFELSSITNSLPIILTHLDKKGIILLSQGFGLEKLNLQNSDDRIGKSVFDVYKDEEHLLKNVKKALKGKNFKDTFEFRGFNITVWYFTIKDENDDINGVFAVTLFHQSKQCINCIYNQSN